MEKEMNYHRKLKSQGWKDYVSVNPYLDWYGEENWKTHLQDAPAMQKYK
jgi:DNA repair photolyase